MLILFGSYISNLKLRKVSYEILFLEILGFQRLLSVKSSSIKLLIAQLGLYLQSYVFGIYYLNDVSWKYCDSLFHGNSPILKFNVQTLNNPYLLYSSHIKQFMAFHLVYSIIINQISFQHSEVLIVSLLIVSLCLENIFNLRIRY